MLKFCTCTFALLILSACEPAPVIEQGADARGHVAPAPATVANNQRVLNELPFVEEQDFEDAMRGLIASDPSLVVTDESGALVWDPSAYGFINEASPASVNPSLWRQARLNNIHGLFEVTAGVYQVRGYDLSNMTLISGEKGWIVVDPLTARETASAAMDLARKHLDQRPVTAIIFTHSHVDHFGGVLGIISADKARADGVRIIAPDGFMAEATSENLLAGTAMSRRAMFMYGKSLDRSARGHVDSGLGKSPAFGRFGILTPTDIVDHTPQAMKIDGVQFVFQNAPESEAPAELTFYLPELAAWCGAEITSRNMHNLYTLRGARVRDALRWSGYIDEVLLHFGGAEVYFASHHWPLWGNTRIVTFLQQQRDTYKYIHDQTVRLFNAGLTPGEIAEKLVLPESLAGTFHNRGYYGTVRHNARAVYQAYLGWYDGNPANLDPLPPVEAGERYIELMGGEAVVLDRAGEAFDAGEFRWAAQLLNHLVFATPGNRRARALLAKTYDQLGYQAESGPWRDVYLSAAFELRHGPPEQGIDIALMEDVLRETPVARFFDTMAVRLNGPEADGQDISVHIGFIDRGESYLLSIQNAVLHHRGVTQGEAPVADATMWLTHDLFIRIMTAQAGLKDLLFSDELEVEGSELALLKFFGLFDKPDATFDIVTP